MSHAQKNDGNDLAETGGKNSPEIKYIPKLEDANDAGTKNSLNCTLILTHEYAGELWARTGLGIVGRDTYGVFPLRGKLLNVREATHKQILENAEINNLIKIIGLQYTKKYLTMDDLKTLRYGKVMIMMDQDEDGSHIKGLFINFIHTNWPELLRHPFLEEFITPIVKAKKKNEVLSFYSLTELEEWKAATPNHNTYFINYYNGLGASSLAEVKQYFLNMKRHRILFKYEGTQDDESIVMAFAKEAVDHRKKWLINHMDDCKRRKEHGLQEQYLYTKTTKHVSYSDFINLEWVRFSKADNIRSIPSVVDGLTPVQRKVLFICFKRNDINGVKVAHLASLVAEHAGYHQGEQMLCANIINLAQSYVGSNNINLLMLNDQFGTRFSVSLPPSLDSVIPGHFYTMMSPLTRLIFHSLDDPLVQYQSEYNKRIEPIWYIPVIPMVLVNGCDSIGTDFPTKIPNHNPRQIIHCLRRMIQGEEPEILHPWHKNFKGSVETIGDTRYFTNGNVAIPEDDKIENTGLPIDRWIQAYIENGGFHNRFKLSAGMSTNTMHAFDKDNSLRRYETVNEILRDFYTLRLEYYIKRKDYLVGMLTAEAARLSDQARFIMEKCYNTFDFDIKNHKAIIDELIKRGYRADPVKEWKRKVAQTEEEEDAAGDEEIEEEADDRSEKKPKKPVDPEKAFQKLTDLSKYDYLLKIPMVMLTEEDKNELFKQRDSKLSELASLMAKTPESLWESDLEALEKKLDEVEENERQE